MNVSHIPKNILNGKYFSIEFNKPNYKCITDLENSQAPEYLKRAAAQIIAITKFATPLAQCFVKSCIAGILLYEGSHLVTLHAMNYLRDKPLIEKLYVNSLSQGTALKMKSTIRNIGLITALGATVSPIGLFSGGLIVTAGIFRGITHYYGR